MLSEKECRAIVERVLGASQADEVRVSLDGGEFTHLRFARNTPSTSGTAVTRTLRVRSTFGSRSGSATGNQLDPGSIESVVRRSEDVARRAPEDPEHVPALEPQEYEIVQAWVPQTAGRGGELLAAGVATSLEEARASGLVAAGFTRADVGFRCLANSNGLFGYHRFTQAYFSETVRTPDGTGSGWAATAGDGVGELDYRGRTRVAIEKARRSQNPHTLEPGTYPAILEPACVGSLLGLLLGAMSARAADEGRSFFTGEEEGTTRIGEKLFPDWIRITSDPASPLAPTTPWASDGRAHRRTDWIRDGVVANLSCDRWWAQERGHDPLPSAPNRLLAGGEGTIEDLIRNTDRGVLVTSMWYIRNVDPRTLLYTGLTRDGVFWIENGEIAWPVNNFRWNESPIRVLRNALEASTAVRVPPRGSRSTAVHVPALRVSEFAFSSRSEAV